MQSECLWPYVCNLCNVRKPMRKKEKNESDFVVSPFLSFSWQVAQVETERKTLSYPFLLGFTIGIHNGKTVRFQVLFVSPDNNLS